MPSGPQLERLVRRFDMALTLLENDAVTRLDGALRLALERLEVDARRLYVAGLSETATASIAVREARARLLIQQVRALLDITAGSPADDAFTLLIRSTYQLGADNALAALSLYEAGLVSLSSTVRAEVLVRATNAAARLAGHGRAFAETAERLIIDGITRGRGWGRVAAELRRETGVTRRAAEAIVRTESIVASDTARRDAYAANDVQYVQRMATMDSRVCGWCANRAGNVYRVEDAPVALHPNDRCYNAPWKPEWQELGLTDDAWFREHRAEAIRRAEEAGETIHTGASPFEKSEGRDPPTPAWTP